MHFNGWSFDEKVLIIRMMMYDLLEDYLEGLDFDNKFSTFNFSYNGKHKITGSRDIYNMF